ncbi:MAG: hypothetical protein C5B53_04375 [Candidatus Melainabacteria bacterium]|nr:MAG: hypothetical protein C5B53_04375 [Candidatus Melainabacteria bacterium]
MHEFMTPVDQKGDVSERIRTKTDRIFADQLNRIYQRTDQLFANLLVLQWIGAIVLALVVSPRVWSGTVSQPHIHLVATVFLGGCIIILPLYLSFRRPGQAITRHVIAAGQVLLSALIIHITGGRIETHFHVFGSLAFLAFYRDWKVLITASLIVAADHLFRGIYWPQSVYGVQQIEPWRWLEHTAWVAFEDAFLIVAIRQSLREMRSIAAQQADLELAHRQVLDKSHRLQLTKLQLSERLDLALKDLITARDSALESSRLKSEFLANMSHEIRTPMNSIIGMADILYSNSQDKKERERLSIIRDAGQGLLTVIGDILDFSKIEAGKLTIELSEVDILTLVEGVAEILASQARAKGIALLTYIDPRIPRVVYGDPGRLRQILLNLIGNAIKFTEVGHVVVKVQLQERNHNKIVAHFSVEDTGIGLSEGELERLFNPFVQADGTTTRKFSGTGLGLSISKHLVGLMGGTIGATSVKEKGSTFYFTMPFECGSDTADKKIPLPVGLEGMRVLIVDDDPACREILCLYLNEWNVENRSTEYASKAVELLKAAASSGNPFDVAILDLFTPGSDALQLQKEIEKESEIADTNLILVTAFDKQGQGTEALRAGFRAYLRKPIKQEKLLHALAVSARQEQASSLAGQNKDQQPSISVLGTGHGKSECLILVAEDHPSNRLVAQAQLGELGYPTQIVSNGLEVLQAVSKSDFALILMDCMMPEMDGFQATAAIRQTELATGRHLPIVAMTARAMSDDRDKCLAAGMDDYLSKPVDLEQLRSMLEKWLPRHVQTKSNLSPKDHGKGNGTSDSILQVINMERLASEIGEDSAEAIWQTHLTVTRAGLQLISDAIKKMDGETVVRQAHKMKGASGSLFCEEMQAICASLEQLAKTKNWSCIGVVFEELCAAFKRVEDAVDVHVPQNKIED